MSTTITRHRWTKDELKHLNATASHAKNKGAAFEKIAEEMGLTKSAVAQTYYAHKRSKKKIGEAVPATSKAPKQAVMPAQVGRPFDFTQFSEAELMEMAQGIKAEVSSRRDRLASLIELF